MQFCLNHQLRDSGLMSGQTSVSISTHLAHHTASRKQEHTLYISFCSIFQHPKPLADSFNLSWIEWNLIINMVTMVTVNYGECGYNVCKKGINILKETKVAMSSMKG